MKQQHIIWLLCAALSVSVLVNVVLAKANLGYFDQAYGEIAKQHLLVSNVRNQLEQGDIGAAKNLLDREIELKGSILAICLMEACSRAAKEVMHDGGKL